MLHSWLLVEQRPRDYNEYDDDDDYELNRFRSSTHYEKVKGRLFMTLYNKILKMLSYFV